MTTPKNSATPKTIAEQTKATNDVTDAVIDGGSVEEIAQKVKKILPTQAAAEQVTVEDEKDEKLSLVQRAKGKVERLKKNKKAQVLLIASVFCAGVAIKKSRELKKIITVEASEGYFEETSGGVNPDETDNSI